MKRKGEKESSMKSTNHRNERELIKNSCVDQETHESRSNNAEGDRIMINSLGNQSFL